MKLTKQKLKEIIKEELLNEYTDLNTPMQKVSALLSKFDAELEYYKGGSTDSGSVEYESNPRLYDKRYKALLKFADNFEKTLKKALNDYKKAWK